MIDSQQQHQQFLRESGMLAQRAQRQVRSELQALILHAVSNALNAEMSEEEWKTLISDVDSRKRDPYTIASELQARIDLKIERPLRLL